MRSVVCIVALCAGSGCGELTKQGTTPVYLVVDALEAVSGEQEIRSDVHQAAAGTASVEVPMPDLVRVSLSLALKDPGGADSPARPSPNNFVTINRYRVRYLRADARNTPGVDVPYGFDGAFTLTVADHATATFTLVRAQAKAEPPLAALARSPVVISTIAEVIFYGRDQTGRETTAQGTISVHFANWPDEAGPK